MNNGSSWNASVWYNCLNFNPQVESSQYWRSWVNCIIWPLCLVEWFWINIPLRAGWFNRLVLLCLVWYIRCSRVVYCQITTILIKQSKGWKRRLCCPVSDSSLKWFWLWLLFNIVSLQIQMERQIQNVHSISTSLKFSHVTHQIFSFLFVSLLCSKGSY